MQTLTSTVWVSICRASACAKRFPWKSWKSLDFYANDCTLVTYFLTNSFAQTRFATGAKVNLGLDYSSMSCSGSLWLKLLSMDYQNSNCSQIFSHFLLSEASCFQDLVINKFRTYLSMIRPSIMILTLACTFLGLKSAESEPDVRQIFKLFISKLNNSWLFLSLPSSKFRFCLVREVSLHY